MCTVTYLPTDTGFILTSSRDEYAVRPTLVPAVYKLSDRNVVYPKDQKKGGTWIAVSDNGDFRCLLNGAFKDHEKSDAFTKSRGCIPLESLENGSVLDYWSSVDVSDVEPFTLLCGTIENDITFWEFVWDADKKYQKKVKINRPAIWSSVTLYNEKVRQQRKYWFDEWLKKHVSHHPDKILSFHQTKHDKNESENIFMKREQGLQTVSISQIIYAKQRFQFRYFDVIKNTGNTQHISIKKSKQYA